MELGNFIFGNSRGEFPVNREWQRFFIDSLHRMGFDGYGSPRTETDAERLKKYQKEIVSQEGGRFLRYENDTFVIMSYYWGEDEEIEQLPNFIYKPTDFQLNWYKYALRDSYMNQDITIEQLEKILQACIESLRKETMM